MSAISVMPTPGIRFAESFGSVLAGGPTRTKLRVRDKVRPMSPSADAEGVDARQRDAAELVRLLTTAADGDQLAFAELYDKTSSRIYGLVVRVLRSPDHAQEVTQEVFVEVWRQAKRYEPTKGSVLAWMTTMAHRRAVDRVRSVSSETARDERYALRSATREIDEVWSDVEQHFDGERVRAGLAKLTALQREALTLAYFGGLSQSQVAAKLEVPLGTVKTRMRDGLISLRNALGVQT